MYGELSKIREELEELADAAEQGCRILQLIEMSDLIGAVEGYLETHFPGFCLNDLLAMKAIIHRAWEAGDESA